MLKIIQNKIKTNFIPHCKGKFQWPMLFNSLIRDLLVAKEAPLANAQLTSELGGVLTRLMAEPPAGKTFTFLRFGPTETSGNSRGGRVGFVAQNELRREQGLEGMGSQPSSGWAMVLPGVGGHLPVALQPTSPWVL